MPSAVGYLLTAGAAAAALFFVLWWMYQGDEYPWVPAGLAASVVMLVAASAREVVVRRAWTQHTREQDKHDWQRRSALRSSKSLNLESARLHAAVFQTLLKQSARADTSDSLPEAHLDVYQLCGDYLANAEEALRSSSLSSEHRLAMRAGQERARNLQKHHLLTWARSSARALTRQAQQRVRLSEKVETANRALDCIDSALKVYPDEAELNQSAGAVREFITSSRVAHWVELAERAAFKGYYRRAIDCYRDALFYLTRDEPNLDRQAAAERITREIELLQARLATETAEERRPKAASSRRRRS